MPAYSFEGPVWNTDTITWSFIQFVYPGDPTFDQQITPALQSTITAAFDKWESVDPSLNFVNVPDSSDESQAADIRVGFADLSTITGEIGETDPKATANGVNFAPDTLVRLENPADLNGLTTNASGMAEYAGTETTLYQVALHEIGHTLGLGHSTVDGGDPNSIMFPTVGPDNPDLDATDIAAIDILYPPPQPAAPTPPPTPSGPTQVVTDNGVSSAITTDDSANAVIGSIGNDTITTGTGTNLIVPGSGNDIIVSQGTDTILPGAGGVDTVFAVGHVVAGVGAGTLLFINGSNTSTVIGGGTGNAVIDGGSGGGLFAAGAGGGSLVFAGTGASTVFGLANGDVLFAGGSAPDLLLAGGGNETLTGIGSTGANVLRGGSGNDLIGGGA
ncbi:MAG TPA: matrixin family metalloprotease, partial [Acetobacteraceae bacterium]|nr:matrixin family metalloprotease [Acetobacteraceae bacterium]